ncbi:DUF202 domain-containing protein [Streptomyces lasalocidi]
MGEVSTTGRDPGLQPERTRLAWRRTTLSAGVAAVLAAKAALHGGASATGLSVCALCCLFFLGFLGVAHHRIQALTAHAHPPALTPHQATAAVLYALALVTCATILLT